MNRDRINLWIALAQLMMVGFLGLTIASLREKVSLLEAAQAQHIQTVH